MGKPMNTGLTVEAIQIKKGDLVPISIRLHEAAVESCPHPALPPEAPVSSSNLALEMRTYFGVSLLDIHHFVDRDQITIGETKEADVFLSSKGLPAPAFPLIRLLDGQTILTFTPEMEGEIEVDGQPTRLTSAADSVPDPTLSGSLRIPLELSSRVVLHWGGVTFALRFVPPARKIETTPWTHLDIPYLNTLALSLAAHLTLIATLLLYPSDVSALERWHRTISWPPGMAFLDLTVPLRSKPPPPPRVSRPRSASKTHASSSRPEARTKGLSPSRTATTAKIRAQFHNMLSQPTTSHTSGGTLTGTLIAAIGTRGTHGTPIGIRGMDRSDGPYFGGSQALGRRRGIGGIDTGCVGARCGRFTDFGSRAGGGLSEASLEIENPEVRDPIDRTMIAKVIRQSRNQIRACYERQLHRHHDLEGKVAVRWVIGATGAVAAIRVTESTMNNRAVESCIIERIRTWRFPQPAGGGRVVVNYPFVFHAY